jgi:class 3 adenylate cyclase
LVGSALNAAVHTMIGHTMFSLFLVGLIISPPADMPLFVHVVFTAVCVGFTLATHKFTSFALINTAVFGALAVVFVICWYGYSPDRLDRGQFAAKLAADSAAAEASTEIDLQRQMLATMAPLHVQSDMVALVATDAYRRGEAVSMTHDLSNVTVCFCKIRTKGKENHRDAHAAYRDITAMHDRVEKLLARYPAAVKIKTVGQTLIVAGPLHNGATEAECEMAARQIFRFSHDVVHRSKLALRAGVCSGNVMATVMGTDRIAYDIFGDTVNTASRCMTTADEGHMQAAVSTSALCGEEYDTPAGDELSVSMKGKGNVTVLRC